MARIKDTSKPAVPNGFKILLGVSLAINLAVAGLVAGSIMRKGPVGQMLQAGR